MIIIYICNILFKLYTLLIYLIFEYYQIIVFICFINLFDKWIVSIYYSYMHYQLYIWIEILYGNIINYICKGALFSSFKIPKLYKIPHSRCMLRQFETRSSARPTAAALQHARLQEKNIIVPLPLIQPELPCQRESQTMIPNPQGSRQTNQGPYIEIKFFTQSCSQKATCVVSCTKI